jgi:hypothetical protein
MHTSRFKQVIDHARSIQSDDKSLHFKVKVRHV